jgi:1-acyl-sn-glycerol-3-phosphate acyltransferase
MIEAKRNPLLNRWVYRLLFKSGLRGAFNRVNIRGANLHPTDPMLPVIWYGNHSAWWDGHVPFALNEEVWRREAYVVVEDTQLSRYQFFRWIGGFSLNRKNARSAVESLSYAARVLTEAPNRSLLIFPQGEILSNDIRPLVFYNGVGHIVKNVLKRASAIALVPIAIRYEFIGEQKPEVFASVVDPIICASDEMADAKQITARMQTALTRELDQLRDDVIHYRLDSFTTLLSGAWSVNRLWDALRGRKQIKDVGRTTSR